MDNSPFDSLHRLCQTCNDWHCSLHFPTEFTILCEGTKEEKEVPSKWFDICAVLSSSKAHQFSLRKYSNFPAGTRFRFHSKYNGAHKKQALVSDLQRYARLSGYNLSTCITRPKEKGNRVLSVALKCQYGTLYRGYPKSFAEGMVTQDDVKKQTVKENTTNRERPGKNRCYTKRPVDPNAICPFGIVIFLNQDGCWYLSTQKPQNCVHKHHLKQDPQQMPSTLRQLNEEEIHLLNNCAEVLISPTNTSNLLNKPGHVHISARQVRYLRFKSLSKELSPNASSAARLIEIFKERDDVSFLCVTHDFENGLLLSGKACRTNLKNALSKIPLEKIEALRQELGLHGNTKMLLIFMWVTNEELRLLKMHPECISWDVTHGTNKEKRDLLIGGFKDGDNRAFHACHGFIVNQRQWVFSLFFRECVPRLIGTEIISRNFLAMTDGDECMITALQGSISKGIYPNAMLGRCVWHLLHLGWKQKITAKKKANCTEAERQIYAWIYSWMNGEVETEKEYVVSRERLMHYLASDEATAALNVGKNDHTKEAISHFLSQIILPLQHAWAWHTRSNIPSLATITTGTAEVLNSSTKYGFMAVVPAMGLDTAAHTMVEKSNERIAQKDLQNAQQKHSNRLWTRSPTRHILTKYAEGLACAAFDRRDAYAVAKISEKQWLVMYMHDRKIPAARMRPKFDRVRVLDVVADEFMTCSCGFPTNMRMPCTHIFAAVKTLHPKMFHVRWWNDFQLYYGRTNPTLDAAFNKILMTPYPGVCVQGLLPDCTGSFPQLHEGTTAQLFSRMKKLHACFMSNIPVIVGEEINNATDEDQNCPPFEDGATESCGFTFDVCHTDGARSLLRNEQKDVITEGISSPSKVRGEAFKILNDTWKVVESSPGLMERMLHGMKAFHTEAIREMRERQEKKRNAVAPPMGGSDDTESLSFGDVVHDRKRKASRGHYFFEGKKK